MKIEDLKIRIGQIAVLGTEKGAHIVKYYSNSYYNKREEMIADGWEEDACGLYKDGSHIGDSCFKNPECNYTLAIWNKNSEGYYELRFLGDRPFQVEEQEKDIFMRVAGFGQTILNKIVESESIPL